MYENYIYMIYVAQYIIRDFLLHISSILQDIRDSNSAVPDVFHSKDVVTFNAAIAACGKASRWRHALQLFFQARKDSGGPWETKTTLENGVKLIALQVKIMQWSWPFHVEIAAHD